MSSPIATKIALEPASPSVQSDDDEDSFLGTPILAPSGTASLDPHGTATLNPHGDATLSQGGGKYCLFIVTSSGKRVPVKMSNDFDQLCAELSNQDPGFSINLEELVGTRSDGTEVQFYDNSPGIQGLRNLAREALGREMYPWKSFKDGHCSSLQDPRQKWDEHRPSQLSENDLNAQSVIKTGKMGNKAPFATNEKVDIIKRQQAMDALLRWTETHLNALKIRKPATTQDESRNKAVDRVVEEFKGLHRPSLRFEALHPLMGATLRDKEAAAGEWLETKSKKKVLLLMDATNQEEEGKARKALALTGHRGSRETYLPACRELGMNPTAPSGEDFFVQLMNKVTQGTLQDLEGLIQGNGFDLAFGNLHALEKVRFREELSRYCTQLHAAFHSSELDTSQPNWENQNPTANYNKNWRELANAPDPEVGLEGGVRHALNQKGIILS